MSLPRSLGRLTFRTQPPSCEEAQTISRWDTTWRDHLYFFQPSTHLRSQPQPTSTLKTPLDDPKPQLSSHLSIQALLDETPHIRDQKQASPAVLCQNSWPTETKSIIQLLFYDTEFWGGLLYSNTDRKIILFSVFLISRERVPQDGCRSQLPFISYISFLSSWSIFLDQSLSSLHFLFLGVLFLVRSPTINFRDCFSISPRRSGTSL